MNFLKKIYCLMSLIVLDSQELYTIDIVTAIAQALVLQNSFSLINNSGPQSHHVRTGLHYEIYNRWHKDTQLSYSCNSFDYDRAIAAESSTKISCTIALDTLCAQPYRNTRVVQGCATKKACKDHRTFHITERLCNHKYQCGSAKKTMSLNRGIGSNQTQADDDILRHPC